MLYHRVMADDAKRRFPHRWPEEVGTPLVGYVTIDYALVNDRMEAKTLTVRMASHNPMTTSIVRALPLGAWMAEDRQRMAKHSLASEWGLTPRQRDRLRQGRIADEPSTAGRPKVTRELLVEVADVYRRAHRTGAAPTQAVADHFDRPRSTAAKWVQRAREERMLGPAEQRRPGELPRTRRKAKK